MENSFDKTFEMRYLEMNEFAEALPTAILALLEETAADHCHAINHSLYDLVSQNIGWVLIAGYIRMERYPKYKEKIVIRTWLSNYSTVRGIRENIIYDQQGNIIGRAKGLWVFFDIAKRRPVQIFEDIKTKWSFNPQESIIHDVSKKITPLQTAQYIDQFNVYHFDVDMNEHVNNIRYLHWVMDSIPEEITKKFYLHSIDGRFISEAQFGDTITSLTDPTPNIPNSFTHTIRTHSNKVCASAVTIWKLRK